MESIIKKDSGVPGKTLAVLGGVHGDEKVGVLAVQKAIAELKIVAGSVYFIFANPLAIEQNKRFIDKNLNRCFLDDPGDSYEERRAVELMDVLSGCDASLDVHASNNKDTVPFVITDNGMSVAEELDFDIVVNGFDVLEPGSTDEFMKRNGKIGVCVECGYNENVDKNVGLAFDSIKRFLCYFGAIDGGVPRSGKRQKVLLVDEVQMVTSESFRLARRFADFETVSAGTVIARDGFKDFIVDKERVVLFATHGKPVGSEAYILGNWL